MRLNWSRIVGTALCSTVVMCATSGHATVQYMCHQIPSEDCEVDEDCGPLYDDPPASGEDPIVCTAPVTNCTWENSMATCAWQEVVATPSVVWRSFNGTTHAYTAQASPPQGYYLEGEMFSLANDG